MKKLLVLILVMSCALCLAFSFAGCKPDNSESSGGGSNTQQGDTDSSEETGGGSVGHTHTYIYKCSQTEHWQVCSVCGKKETHSAHTVEDGVCYTCGFVERSTAGLEFTKSTVYDETVSFWVSKGTSTDSKIIIPSFHENLPIIIGDLTFSGCKSLIIGNGVISIDYGAFKGCTNLTSVTIPDSVTSIGEEAFNGCTSLKSITIGNSVTSIGNSAFNGCTSLESVNIGNSVTSIGRGAFKGCTNLTSVTIPDSVTSIGVSAFYDCTSLTSITIPDSVTSIGNSAFSECTSLTSITIPNSVTSIGEEAFKGCTSLKSITIGNSVTSIGWYAFRDCTSLQSITIPNSVTSISTGTFFNTAYYNNPDNWADDVLYIDNCLIEAKKTLSGRYKILQNTKLIAEEAFADCTNLESITIPNSVISIGIYAFKNCMNLTSLVIPDSVMKIAQGAFLNCINLRSISVGNNITFIGTEAFINTAYYNNPDNWADDVLYIDNYLIGAKSTLSGNYEIKEGTKLIAGRAFYRCISLTSITIPNSLTFIGYRAFECCKNLESIDMGKGVSTIYGEAFWGCQSLTSITIPKSVISIGDDAFYECTSLEGVYITDLTAWCNIDFDNECSNPLFYAPTHNLYLDNQLITELTAEMLQGVTTIKNFAFFECESLENITIPNSVTSIGEKAFKGCTSLESVNIGNSVTSIGDSAFRDCTNLESVNIGNSVTSIGDSAFRDCTSLESITIPNSVTEIGYYAFEGCTSLTSVKFENPDGWWLWHYGSLNFLELLGAVSSQNLENSETAAKYLTRGRGLKCG